MNTTDNSMTLIHKVTNRMIYTMFPDTPKRNIDKYWSYIRTALIQYQLTDKTMVLMALATIRAETEGFVPISEYQSKYNTSPKGHPFDLYDNRKDLGNLGYPDGERFRGRGFIQLTGRDNYTKYSEEIGKGDFLIKNPDSANDPEIASMLLACFLYNKKDRIRDSLSKNDLANARRLINGGSHGLNRFKETYQTGESLFVSRA
jgi:predicted chitinase